MRKNSGNSSRNRMSNLACDISSRCFFLVKFLIVAFRSSRLPRIGGFHLHCTFSLSFSSSITFQSSTLGQCFMRFLDWEKFTLSEFCIKCWKVWIRDNKQRQFMNGSIFYESDVIWGFVELVFASPFITCLLDYLRSINHEIED